MPQLWRKEGFLLSGTRAQIPTVLPVSESLWRIFYSNRTPDNKSYIQSVDIDPEAPFRILDRNLGPILPLGGIGEFDSFGTMPSCFHQTISEVRMYYIGWSIRADAPFQNSIGLAISKDGGKTFHKAFRGPVLSTGPEDPFTSTTPFVIQRGDSALNIDLYYASGTEYRGTELRYCIKLKKHFGHVHYNEIDDCRIIEYVSDAEGGICRPCVIGNHMWYCYRNRDPKNSYKIGYAKRTGLDRWSRTDTEMQWSPVNYSVLDTEMACYPFVLKYRDTYYMFYNGNGFGATGIGLATLPTKEIDAIPSDPSGSPQAGRIF